MAGMETVQILKQAPLFKSASPEALKAIAACCVKRSLPKGQVLFSAGQESKGLYIVAKGTLTAFRENQEGREQVIHVDKAVTTLAEVPAFDGGPYPSHVVAKENSVVFFLGRSDLNRLCLKYPEVALSAVKVLAMKLRRTAAMVESLALRGVEQRLAAFLLSEASARGKRTPKGVMVTVPTNTEIGARLGSVREVVSRALARMSQNGLVKLGRGGNIVLVQEKLLRQFAEDE
jgi:CRP-like cAMP-binding protein